MPYIGLYTIGVMEEQMEATIYDDRVRVQVQKDNVEIYPPSNGESNGKENAT